MLDKIVSFASENEKHIHPSINSLISALALKKAGRENEGQRLLKNIAEKHPSHPGAQWMLSKFSGENTPAPAVFDGNENYRILELAGALE